ncbi:MAG: hypothetical protein IKC64_05120 [Clostridia bacterium]|nr:hypothetical protein [Clostridia bacterium]
MAKRQTIFKPVFFILLVKTTVSFRPATKLHFQILPRGFLDFARNDSVGLGESCGQALLVV